MRFCKQSGDPNALPGLRISSLEPSGDQAWGVAESKLAVKLTFLGRPSVDVSSTNPASTTQNESCGGALAQSMARRR